MEFEQRDKKKINRETEILDTEFRQRVKTQSLDRIFRQGDRKT